jgi:hypothetical protein
MIVVFMMLGLLIGGFICAVAGIVLVVVFSKMKKNGSRVAKPLLVLSIIFLVGSGIAFLIPCGFFALVFFLALLG